MVSLAVSILQQNEGLVTVEKLNQSNRTNFNLRTKNGRDFGQSEHLFKILKKNQFNVTRLLLSRMRIGCKWDPI